LPNGQRSTAYRHFWSSRSRIPLRNNENHVCACSERRLRGPDTTDWPQITALYQLLLTITNNDPVVALNHAVAVAMTRGPHAGLALLDTLQTDPRLGAGHHLPAARAHLLEMTGDTAAARDQYNTAAVRTTNLAQQRYLHSRAAALNNH
jgi:predicted RNA polymerase sigma factor